MKQTSCVIKQLIVFNRFGRRLFLVPKIDTFDVHLSTKKKLGAHVVLIYPCSVQERSLFHVSRE